MTMADPHKFLARFVQYDPTVPGSFDADDRVILGYDFGPTRMLQVLINYDAPIDGLGDGVGTARLQVALR